jgi:hypothetical protein
MTKFRIPSAAMLAAVVAVPLSILSVHCSSSYGAADGTESTGAAAQAETAAVEYVDCMELAGVHGKLPKDDSLSPLEDAGRCVWVLSTARTLDPKSGQYVQGTENLFGDIAKKNGITIAFLDVLSESRKARWERYGVMNDPGCTPTTEKDEYGFQLDKCEHDEFSTGVVGVRKFPNPKFDRAKWNHDKYGVDPTMEPPYLVGQTCGSCHVSFDPTKPAADPINPTWDNLKFAIGNQYLREGRLFQGYLKDGAKDFRWHVLETQEPGTSDTSRIASDHINNPNAINPIFNLANRPWHTELLKKGQFTYDLSQVDINELRNYTLEQTKTLLQPIKVAANGEPHAAQSILKGGEDSVGPVGALLRVYLNIGMCSNVWLKHFDPINGTTAQTPITTSELYYDCLPYQDMLTKVPAIFTFLATSKPLYLRNAPGGAAKIDESKVAQGAQAFATACASCHSSKQPPEGLDEAARIEWFKGAVQDDDFLENNFLSDDKSYSVTEVGTNSARALHSNHMEGHIWGDAYASQSYLKRKFPGNVSIENPYGDSFNFKGPDGGPGYYRTPTLASMWFRAPFLHNRALGTYTGDPSLEGRMVAFNDAVEQLLSLKPRTHVIKRTSTASFLPAIGNAGLHLPAGTVINAIANSDPNDFKTKLLVASLIGADFLNFNAPIELGGWFRNVNPGTALMKVSLSPDLVEDRGHTYGSNLSVDDRRALIEYLKTL